MPKWNPETRQYSNVGRNALLEPDKIDNVLTYFPRNPNVYELAELFPLVNYNTEKVQMDYAKPRAGGMTPAVADGTETPIYGGWGRGYLEFEAATFREKCILMELDLENLRQIGTVDQLETAERMLRRKFRVLEERLMNRLEWMRRQVLFDGTVTAEMENGDLFSVEYQHGSHLDPVLTSGDLWSATTTADPLGNLQEWMDDYLIDTEFSIKEIKLPMRMMQHLQANKKFQDALSANFPLATASAMQVKEQIATYIGLSGPQMISHSSGKINFETELVAAAANGASTIRLESASQLEAGDRILIARVSDNLHERVEVDSVSGNVVTITGTIDATGGFARGDVVKYFKPVVPFNRILIVGEFAGNVNTVGLEGAPDPQLITQWGEMASVLSRYADFTSPKSGIFTKQIDKIQNEDVSRLEQIIGIKALPKINYPDGWMAPQVLA